jgi:glutamine amidotransferase
VPPLIAVLDYEIGNLRSAQKALQHVGADARLTADPGLVREAAAVVLPGVGAFGRCMEALHRTGLDALAREAVDRNVPFLGICIGMQMLFEGSEESPGEPGLGILPGTVRLLPAGVKRPQMQWNVLERRGNPGLLEGVPDPAWAYFVHSYAADTDDAIVTATCDYGGPVVAAVAQGPVWATQFHPEKSGRTGLAALSAFVAQATLVPR